MQSGGVSLNRDKIVPGLSLLVGIAALGSAANQGLGLVAGLGGDALTLVLNAGLGLAGLGYYLYRKK